MSISKDLEKLQSKLSEGESIVLETLGELSNNEVSTKNYSNSPLVSYTKISPNRTSPRNHEIDTITIHCVVGQCSVETLGNIFAASSRQASSNYGVGVDGRIGMYVEEKDRSWCTGGRDSNGNPIKVNGITGSDNDHRAITIEVASDTFHPYKVNDKAYAALINLVADICKRNNIKKLLWKGDKSLVGKINKQNMTVHRWFANKSCPGDYLYNLHSQIAEEVNKKLGTKVVESTTPKVPETPTISNEALIYEWLLMNTKFDTAAIAGILANLEAESGFKSNNLQNSYEKSLGYTDDTYTSAVDSGKYKNFVKDSAGYGLAQWTFWSRKQSLLNYAKSKKSSIGDYEMQLEYLLSELKNYKKVWETLTNSKNTEDDAYSCGHIICHDFEAPAAKVTSSVKRGERAKELYNKYKGITKPTTDKVGALYESIDINDILIFSGNSQYTSANSTDPKSANSSTVKVTHKVGRSTKHPVHVRSIDEQGNFIPGVYGWVNIEDLQLEVSSPYKVKVTASALNYRGGPGTEYKVLGVIKDKGVYTIVQEKNGWGQLKSKVGWINLNYTKKI